MLFRSLAETRSIGEGEFLDVTGCTRNRMVERKVLVVKKHASECSAGISGRIGRRHVVHVGQVVDHIGGKSDVRVVVVRGRQGDTGVIKRGKGDVEGQYQQEKQVFFTCFHDVSGLLAGLRSLKYKK